MTDWPNPDNIDPAATEALALVNSHAVLEVCGSDTDKFLQGQCSADIAALGDGEATAGTICTVKGRVVTSFIAAKHEGAVLLMMPRDLVPITADYLGKYAAFYKVELNQWLHPCVIANADKSPVPCIACSYELNGRQFHDGLLTESQQQALCDALETQDIQLGSEALWLDRLLQAGWLVLGEHSSQQYLPHQLSLDLLGAINFQKGCYTGQEIIARMEYRGKPKKRLRVVALNGNIPRRETLPVEIKSTDDSQSLGELLQLDSTAQTGLAVLPVDLPPLGSFLCTDEELQYQIAE